MTTTWTRPGTRSALATCTSGSESAPSSPARASQTVAFSSAVAGNTVTVRGMTFTAIANGSTPASTQEFAVGAGGSADTDTGTAFAAAVNANASVLGITAVNASGTVTLTATDYGTVGNGYTLAKSGTPITVGGATFAGGVDYVGVPLKDVGALSVKAEAVTASATITGGSIKCYVLNGRTNRWLGYPDGDLSPGSAAQGFAWAFTVSSPLDYIAWLPSGVTISAGSMTVHIDATEPDRRETSGRTL